MWTLKTAGAGTPTYKIFFGATAVESDGTVGVPSLIRWSSTICNNAGSTTAQWAAGDNINSAPGYGSLATTPAENTNSGSPIVIKGTFNIANTTGSIAGERGQWIVEFLLP
jgi:hypothetical protein